MSHTPTDISTSVPSISANRVPNPLLFDDITARSNVRDDIYAYLNRTHNTHQYTMSNQPTQQLRMEPPQYVEPTLTKHAPPPMFRNWFNASEAQQKQGNTYNVSNIQSSYTASPTSAPIYSQQMNNISRNIPQVPSSPPSFLGKRTKPEEVDTKKKDLVFKGFMLEPESKKIKFITTDRKADGINDGAWSDKEHEDFLKGLEECGFGKWRAISEQFVKTRTRVQVASHAQKYFGKLKRREKKAAEESSKQEEKQT
jgi:SHAQKYF class myb-like DNA-binding protein